MWMVRAGEDAFLIGDFTENNYVAIGWNELGDLNGIKNKEKIKELVEQTYGDYKPGQIRSAAGQIYRFLQVLKKEDYVISYDPEKRVYFVGEIKSDYEYNIEKSNYHHLLTVKWLGEVDRDKLSISTRNTLGAISTLFEINNEAQTEIISFLKGKEPIKDAILEEADEELIKEDMVLRAHELIKDKILKLDWKEMERLVAGILRAMGYKTLMTDRGSDRGRDIEASPDGMMLKEPRILAEIKHRKEQVNAEKIRSFHSILRTRKGLYVSLGGFSKDAKYEAERSTEQITLIDLDRLVDLIIQSYDDFDVDTKLLIPLSKIYWPT